MSDPELLARAIGVELHSSMRAGTRVHPAAFGLFARARSRRAVSRIEREHFMNPMFARFVGLDSTESTSR